MAPNPILHSAPLGQDSRYPERYDPAQLYPIPRKLNRENLGLSGPLPFEGADIWNAYELSWLDSKGKPVVALGEFTIPYNSPNIIESKSFKLYLNSLNEHRFESKEKVQQTLEKDLSEASGSPVSVKLISVDADQSFSKFAGICLDGIETEIDTYTPQPDFLKVNSSLKVEEKLYSNLLKSNCLKTGQPDWADVLIHYEGAKIDHEGLLKYLISLRHHQGFHEDTVERIYVDLLRYCQPSKLTVYARYTRRGGLDINPFRSNFQPLPENLRQSRQ